MFINLISFHSFLSLSLSLSFILLLSSSCLLAVSRLKNGPALAREKQLLMARAA